MDLAEIRRVRAEMIAKANRALSKDLKSRDERGVELMRTPSGCTAIDGKGKLKPADGKTFGDAEAAKLKALMTEAFRKEIASAVLVKHCDLFGGHHKFHARIISKAGAMPPVKHARIVDDRTVVKYVSPNGRNMYAVIEREV